MSLFGKKAWLIALCRIWRKAPPQKQEDTNREATVNQKEFGFDDVLLQTLQKHGTVERVEQNGKLGKDFTKKEADELAKSFDKLIEQGFFDGMGSFFKKK